MNFLRTAEINQTLERFLSRERLEKYLSSANGDLNAAIGLHEHNTRLSEAFYVPLQILEICLRNAIHIQMSVKYGANWLVNRKPPLATSTIDWIQESVDDIGGISNGKTIGHLVAELKLAFWVSLLGHGYDNTLWRQTLYKAFLAKSGQRRSVVHGRMNALRRFRNRVAHHEPIFQKDLDMTHQEIVEALEWMCPTTSQWAASLSRYESVKHSSGSATTPLAASARLDSAGRVG